MSFRIGDVIDRRYRIEDSLGSGGFAHVYLATDLHKGRQVALKTHRPESPKQRIALLEEFKQLRGLKIERIPAMYDQSEENGQLYLVIEYIPGRSLEDWISASGDGLPVQQALQWIRYLLDTLASVHRAGLTHRDVKPDNIIIHAQSGLPYLIDFGLAKEQGETRIAGFSPFYAAPEQRQLHGQTSPATDVYAVGAILFALLVGTGKQTQWPEPQSDDRHRSIIEAQLRANPYVSESIIQIVWRAMAYHPNERFPDAAAMQRELHPLCLTMSHATIPIATNSDAEMKQLRQERDQFAVQISELQARLNQESLPDHDEVKRLRTQRRRLVAVAGICGIIALIASIWMLTSLLRPNPGVAERIVTLEVTRQVTVEVVAPTSTSAALAVAVTPTATVEPSPELVPILSGLQVTNGISSEAQNSWTALSTRNLPITLQLNGSNLERVKMVALYMRQTPTVSLTMAIRSSSSNQIVVELEQLPRSFTSGTYQIWIDAQPTTQYLDLNDYLRILPASGVVPEHLYSSDLYPSMDIDGRPKRVGETFALLYKKPDRNTSTDFMASVRRNDRLAILDDSNREWYRVRLMTNDGRNNYVGWVLRWVAGDGHPARPDTQSIQIPHDLRGKTFGVVQAELLARGVPEAAFLLDAQSREKLGAVYDQFGPEQMVSTDPPFDGWWTPGRRLIIGYRAP